MKRVKKNKSWMPISAIVAMIEDRIVPDDLPNLPRYMLKDVVSKVAKIKNKAAVYAGPKVTRIEYHESVVQDAVDAIKMTDATRYVIGKGMCYVADKLPPMTEEELEDLKTHVGEAHTYIDGQMLDKEEPVV